MIENQRTRLFKKKESKNKRNANSSVSREKILLVAIKKVNILFVQGSEIVFKNLQTILRSSSLDKTNVRIFKQASGCNKASFGLNEILEEKKMRSHLIQKFFYFSSKILSIKELSLKSTAGGVGRQQPGVLERGGHWTACCRRVHVGAHVSL
jgi:hypothetical protein